MGPRHEEDAPLDGNIQELHLLYEVLPVLALSILTSSAPPIFLSS